VSTKRSREVDLVLLSEDQVDVGEGEEVPPSFSGSSAQELIGEEPIEGLIRTS
jgi:hypothetical protein